jgi:hypothetical protein
MRCRAQGSRPKRWPLPISVLFQLLRSLQPPSFDSTDQLGWRFLGAHQSDDKTTWTTCTFDRAMIRRISTTPATQYSKFLEAKLATKISLSLEEGAVIQKWAASGQ